MEFLRTNTFIANVGIKWPEVPRPIRYENNIPIFKCGNCNKEGELPLLCRACNIWVCSGCWLQHDVEKMKEDMLMNNSEAYRLYFPNV